MSKPLVPRIYLDDEWQKVVYENLPLVCFECSLIGHTGESCPTVHRDPLAGILAIADGQSPKPVMEIPPEPQAGFGPWMLVTKKRKRGIDPFCKPKNLSSQRPTSLDNKGNSASRKGNDESAKGKGKVGIEEADKAKGLLGPGPGTRSAAKGKRTSEAGPWASTSSDPPRGPDQHNKGPMLVSIREATQVQFSVAASPPLSLPIQSVKGANGTDMQ
ncbi:unnamed protein product, partial [Linum tenue]